ncbi:MAG: hypothetical protein QOD53_2271 [Thermoleophilaceae bacterium]|jgi:hypothetical protein|nr:hypothetical protein [Thermoleophilaceae bacterium]
MKKLQRSRPSPALIVSIAALVMSMGGTGYAALSLPKNSVGGKQLRSAAVNSKKVKDGSLRLADFAGGDRSLLKGDMGLRGLDGADGHDGANGATSVTVRNAEGTDFTAPGESFKTASCQAGERAVGGGGYIAGLSDPGDYMQTSVPTTDGSFSFDGGVANGWRVQAHAGGTDTNRAVSAYVLCASP